MGGTKNIEVCAVGRDMHLIKATLRLLACVLATVACVSAATVLRVHVLGDGSSTGAELAEALIWNVPVFSLLTWIVLEVSLRKRRHAHER